MAQKQQRSALDDAARRVMVEVQRDLLRFLTRQLRDADEARDVLHDFYTRVLSRIDDVRDSEKLRGWMGRVLHSVLADHFRRRARRTHAEAEQAREEAGDVPAWEEELDAAVCNCLYKLLPTLRPAYADILWRADLIGQSRTEIAAALGIDEANVRVRLHRARLALKQRLIDTCRTCPEHGFLDCACDRAVKMRAGLAER